MTPVCCDQWSNDSDKIVVHISRISEYSCASRWICQETLNSIRMTSTIIRGLVYLSPAIPPSTAKRLPSVPFMDYCAPIPVLWYYIIKRVLPNSWSAALTLTCLVSSHSLRMVAPLGAGAGLGRARYRTFCEFMRSKLQYFGGSIYTIIEFGLSAGTSFDRGCGLMNLLYRKNSNRREMC